MVGTVAALRFRMALLVVLVSCCLSSYVIAHAQSGPSWEVPVAVVQELRFLPVVALVLAAVGLGLHIWGRRGARVRGKAQRGFMIVLAIAFILPFTIWNFQPEQWPFRYEILSFLAMIQFVPVVIAALVCFWLLGFRWARGAAV